MRIVLALVATAALAGVACNRDCRDQSVFHSSGPDLPAGARDLSSAASD